MRREGPEETRRERAPGKSKRVEEEKDLSGWMARRNRRHGGREERTEGGTEGRREAAWRDSTQ